MSDLNVRYVLTALMAAFCTLCYGSLVILGTLLHVPRSWLNPLCRLWARGILIAAGMRVSIAGLEHLPDEPAVLVGNHQGIFEILALMAYMPRQPVFVTKQEAFRIPLFGQAIAAFGHIPIDRGEPEQAIASIRKGAESLRRNGDHVVFFPEGTRTRDGRLKPFKKGAFVFAIESGMPIVPFAIEGSYQALPPGRKTVHPGLLRLSFLPGIQVEGYDFARRNELRDLAYERIATALDRLRQTQPLTPETPLPQAK